MNENVDKQIEQLVDKMMNNSKLVSPSLDFTTSIMTQIETLSQTEITTYKPLISKRNWFVLGALFIVLFGLSILGTPTEANSWFNALDFSILTNNKVSKVMSNITISNTVLYTVVFFGAMLFIQIPLLKNYFDKRLNI